MVGGCAGAGERLGLASVTESGEGEQADPLSGTGEALLVDAVANQSIQVFAFSIDLGGTSPTAEFDYGTQASAACDSGATALTGAMAGALDYFAAPVAKQLCLNLGGTNPTAEGWVTYVQK